MIQHDTAQYITQVPENNTGGQKKRQVAKNASVAR